MSCPSNLKFYYQYIDALHGAAEEFPEILHSKAGRRCIHPLRELHRSPFSRRVSALGCRFQARPHNFLPKSEHLILDRKKMEQHGTYHNGGVSSFTDEQTTICSSLGVVFGHHISRDVLEAAGSRQRCHYDTVLQGNVADPQRREQLGMSFINHRHFCWMVLSWMVIVE